MGRLQDLLPMDLGSGLHRLQVPRPGLQKASKRTYKRPGAVAGRADLKAAHSFLLVLDLRLLNFYDSEQLFEELLGSFDETSSGLGGAAVARSSTVTSSCNEPFNATGPHSRSQKSNLEVEHTKGLRSFNAFPR